MCSTHQLGSMSIRIGFVGVFTAGLLACTHRPRAVDGGCFAAPPGRFARSVHLATIGDAALARANRGVIVVSLHGGDAKRPPLADARIQVVMIDSGATSTTASNFANELAPGLYASGVPSGRARLRGVALSYLPFIDTLAVRAGFADTLAVDMLPTGVCIERAALESR